MSVEFDTRAINILTKMYLHYEGLGDKEEDDNSCCYPNDTGSSGDQNKLPYAKMYHEMVTHAQLLKLLANEIHKTPTESESMHLKILIYGALFKFDELCFRNYLESLIATVGRNVSEMFVNFLKRTDALQIIRRNAIDLYDVSVVTQQILSPFIDNQSKILNIIALMEKTTTPDNSKIKKQRRLGVLQRSPKPNIGEILGKEIKTAVQFYECDSSDSKVETETVASTESLAKPSMSLKPMFSVVEIKESKPSNVPAKKSAPIKPTASYLLRLKSNITKMHENEVNWLDSLCKGGYDSAVINSYAKDKKAEIENEEMVKIEKKHLDGLLTFEEMLIARDNVIKKNKEKYESFLEEKKQWEQQMEEWKAKEYQRILNSVGQVQTIKENVCKVKKVVEETKRNMVADVKQHKATMKCRIVEEKKKELEKKCGIIKQIRALHVVVKTLNKDKIFDFTETSNMGLFGEMSLAELKERLSHLKVEMQKEMADRRSRVLEMKKQSQFTKDNAREMIEEFEKERRNMKLLSKTCRDEKPRLSAVQADERIVALRSKLEEKRAMRRALMESH